MARETQLARRALVVPALALLLALGFGGRARAQAEPAPPPPAGAAPAEEDASPADEDAPPAEQDAPPADAPPLVPIAGGAKRLVGVETFYGVYVSGRSVGFTRARYVARDDGVRLIWESHIGFGDRRRHMLEVIDLGPDLRLRAFRGTDDRRGELRCLSLVRADDGTLRRTRWLHEDPAGEPKEESAEVAAPEGVMASGLASYLAPLVDWKEGDARSGPFFNVNAAELRPGWVRCEGARRIVVRGREVDVLVLRSREGESSCELHVADGRVVQKIYDGDDGPSYRYILAADEDEARADIPELIEAAAADPEASGDDEATRAARAVAADFLRGFNDGDRELLERTIDFEAMHAALAATGGPAATMSVAELKEDFLARAAERRDDGPPMTDRELEAFAAALEVKIDGDRATVGPPGAPDPMELARGEDGAWRVVGWPVLAK